MKKDRIVLIAISILNLALAVILVYSTVHYLNIIKEQDSQITGLATELAEAQADIASLEDDKARLTRENRELNQTIGDLASDLKEKEQNITALTDIIHGLNPSKLKTVIWHISQKGPTYDWGNTPDVQYAYQKILNGSGPYEVLLLPEYKGNLNWTETLEWISSNFTGIQIALSVWEGGDAKLPNPNVQLIPTEIQQARSACDIGTIRIAEPISWYMEQNQTFPLDYFRSILAFCRQNNLQVLWSEWKIEDEVITQLRNYISEYEDIVTVVCQTNSEFIEPLEGFTKTSTFRHWGASPQSWYWAEHHEGSSEMDMPTSLMIRHTQTAISIGAEVLQFEPNRYFFDNGEPRDIVGAIWLAIK